MRIAGFVLALLAFIPLVSDGAEASKSFSGRVIYCDNAALEVKKGPKEMLFVINESTRVVSNKTDRTASDLDLCQQVTVKYAGGKKGRVALEVDILRESDCRP
ncbi:MAG TPA: hypothetical protein PK573_09440 [Spirochaetota bacterium]|nr:hypothetical protein [Spirochaetota bacterium]HRZ27639.1 hypothetical protein [Spirochaetota bacterium]